MRLFFDCLWAFVVGGAFCAAAQLLLDLTSLTPARILVGYVCAGVLVGAVGLYDSIYELAGCGVSVPLIGFGGLIARGVREAVDRDGIFGVLTGPLTAAAGGTTAALIFGFVAALIFKSHPKALASPPSGISKGRGNR